MTFCVQNIDIRPIVQGINIGIEQGIVQGIEQRLVKERTNTIKMLMKQLNKSFEEVYKFAQYDESEIETYGKLCKE